MLIDNMAGRSAATLLGLALAAGGASLLFGDVIFGHAAFTQKHFQTVCIVLGTTIAAYAAHHAWNNRHLAACLGLAAIAAAGTGLIVWNSLGRQTDAVMVASGAYDKIVGERRDLETSLAIDRASIIEYRKAADKECASGEGSRCRGARSSVAFYENSAKGTEARLKLLETPKPVDPSAEAFGNLAEALGFNKAKAKALSMLFMPYFVVLFFEFGTTISFGYAFSPKRSSRIAANPSTLAAISDAELIELRRQFAGEPPVTVSSPRNDPSKRGGISSPRTGEPKRPNNSRPGRGGYTKDEAAADLVTRLALGERFASQDEVAERYGIAKSTASEWLTEWERDELIPTRTRQGKHKALASS